MVQVIAYEQLEQWEGQEIGVSSWLQTDQARVNIFADATGDHQWIHVDVERATRERGGTIVHGFLTLALIGVFAPEICTYSGVGLSLFYGLNKVRFTNEVPVGSRIRGRQRLLSVVPRSGGKLCTYEFVIEIEGRERPACIAEGLGLVFPEGH
ncbi:MaoC family dehydratase [Mesorhizobium sangaii]|uniref:Acyl dehydratase n=1 Tax=Mesorhizobium sangaii TaxID=505389 RepID=A0A841PNX6_9HYPH|nr:MaoC family dehydratase [Mesorhizobium sangaii]MBB6414358.1 acyl dehydratase [Mesorhizobium sangaii]